MTSQQVDTRVRDQIAKTTIEQEFYNPNPRQLEGTFLFPVPRGASLDRFTMEINGQKVEAELLAGEKARKLYEDIVRSMRDPALLEYADRDLFKVRIFPIEPHSKKHITLTYTQLLKADGDLIEYTLPLQAEKSSSKPLKNLSLKVEIESKVPLKSIYSPSHNIEISRHGDHKATVGYEASNLKPQGDFQLFFAREEGEFGLNLLSHRTGREDGYFILLATPSTQIQEKESPPKDILFVLDTSGSMAGGKLAQAKKALLFCVENLNPSDRFEVIRFSTEVEPLFERLAQADSDNQKQARQFIENLKPMGGTAIDDALRTALAQHPPHHDRPCIIIFLTDGRPTIGNTAEDQILKTVTADADALTRVFCFGIGTDVNTHLLDQITEQTKAFSQYVLPDEDLELKVSSFYTKIKEPALVNPKLIFPDGIRATKLYPSPLPDLFKGQQLAVAGRYSGHGTGELILEGLVNGKTRRFSYRAEFPEHSGDHDFAPRLWATRRVGYLLDEIRLHGENQELKDEVTALARRYAIVTPYTAYLILEDERRRHVPTAFRSLPEMEQRMSRMTSLNDSVTYWAQQPSGADAVAGARSASKLKMATAPEEAIVLGGAEAVRPQLAPSTAGRAFDYGAQPLARQSQTLSTQARNQATEYTAQTRFVAGRTFYLNGEQWIDSLVQASPEAKRVRLQFGSEEYFKFLDSHPQALSWFSLGRNLQVMLAGTIYEISE